MVIAAPASKWLPALAVAVTAVLLVGAALLHPSTRVAGLEGDPQSAVWQLHEMDVGHLGLVEPTTTHSANAPTGARLRRPIEISTAAFDSLALMMTKVLGPVTAYNALLVLAVLTNGAAMLFLARRLRYGVVAATVSALAFVAAPPLLTELQLHAALSFVFTIPLVTAFGVEMVEGAGTSAAVWAGAVTGVAAYVNPYLPLYTGVVLLVFCIAATVNRRRSGLLQSAVALGSAALVALPAVGFVLANRSEVVSDTRRTIGEVAQFSLGGNDYVHAFGDAWLIIPILVCALLGLMVLRSRTRGWWAFPVIAVVGFSLGLPPDAQVVGVTVRTPSALLFDLLPVWRVVGRASVLVWFVVALLVGAAASRVENRPNARRVTAVFAGVVVLACAAWVVGARDRGRPWFPLDQDPELTALLSRSSGRVAEYPLWGFDNAIGPYLLRQSLHGRPLLNGGLPGTQSAALASVAGNVADPQAVSALAVAGVTRVAASRGAAVPPGLERRASTARGASVYDVPPQADPAVAIVTRAGPSEAGPDGVAFRWVADRARIQVMSARPGVYELSFSAWAPNGIARQLGVASADPLTLSTQPSTFASCVRTRATADGVAVATVPVRTTAPPVRLGPDDPRRASFGIASERARPGCPGERS